MLIILLLSAVWIAFLLGERRGWKEGIHIAGFWEGVARDYRMMYDTAIAQTESEVLKAKEVRDLERMYDGY